MPERKRIVQKRISDQEKIMQALVSVGLRGYFELDKLVERKFTFHGNGSPLWSCSGTIVGMEIEERDSKTFFIRISTNLINDHGPIKLARYTYEDIWTIIPTGNIKGKLKIHPPR